MIFTAKSVESDGKRSGSVTKTDDETTDKEDTEKDVEMEQSNLENINEDEDDASVERLVYNISKSIRPYLMCMCNSNLQV